MLNKAQVIGRLGQDPDIRYTNAGTPVANISVATSERWKDKQSGEQKESTEWHRCSAFGRTAEVMGEYLRKGSLVYIEGRLQTRKWQDQKGNDRYSTEIKVDRMQMLDTRGGQGGGQQPAHPQQQQPEAANGGGAPADFDSDIPFMRLDGRLY